MSRRSEGALFVGRLGKNARVRDLEDIFEPYGRLARCEIKYGAEMAYAFIDYEDRRDAEDAIKYENGREIAGSAIIVEWAKGAPRRPGGGGGGGGGSMGRRGAGYNDECYRCHRTGHFARDCPEDRYGYGYRSSRGSGSRYRSPSPRRRRRSRSRSRSRDRRRRSRSHSRDRRSRSKDRRRRSRSRSHSKSKSKRSRSRSRSHSRSRSKSASKSRSGSRSRSGSAPPVNGAADIVQSRSRSRSHSASGD